jgi:hypothetical protein
MNPIFHFFYYLLDDIIRGRAAAGFGASAGALGAGAASGVGADTPCAIGAEAGASGDAGIETLPTTF